MLLYHFHNFEPSYSFVFMEGGAAMDIEGASDFPLAPPEEKRVEKHDELQSSLPEHQEPVVSPEVKKGKKIDKAVKRARAERGQLAIETRLDRQRILTDEERPQYVLKIKEAIETLGPDRWYEFVSSPEHQQYNGDYKKWNADFSNLLLEAGQATAEEIKDPVIQRKYVAGLQCFLVDRFTTAGISFESGSGRKVNKFTYVDGYLGAYTMSALGAYLNSPLYKPTAKVDKTKWDANLLESELHQGFKTPGREKEFNVALAHLRSQFKGADFSQIDSSTVDVHPAEPTAPPIPENHEIQSDGIPAIDKTEPLVTLDDLPEAQKKGVTQLLQDAEMLADSIAMDSLGLELLTERKSELEEELASFESESIDTLGPNPDAEVDIDILDEDYMRPSAWPRKAYDQWVELYKELDGMSVRFISPEIVKKKRQAVDQAFKDYKESLAQYFKVEEEIVSGLHQRLRQNIFQEFSKYSFPSNMDVSMFYINRGMALPHTFRRNLEAKIPYSLFSPRPKTKMGYLDAKEILTTYLGTVPSQDFDLNNEEGFRSSIKKDKAQALSQAFTQYEKYGSQLNGIDVFNTLIYLNNAEQFAQWLKGEVNDSYQRDYRLALQQMDEEPYDKMLARVRKAKAEALASADR